MRSLNRALAELERGLSALADWRGAPSGCVRLTTFSSGARMILAAKLPQFLTHYPDVSVEVNVDS